MRIFRYSVIGAALALASCTSTNYIDRSTPPEPGPAPVNDIGKAKSFTLENGLKVFVVEDHKLPRVSWQLTIDRGPIMEGDKVGVASMTGDLLSQGTENRTKDEINEEIDFMGASFSTSSTGIYASSLTKHADNLLGITQDVLLHPVFPEEELEKNKKRTLSGLASSKNDPNQIASNVGDALRYGKDHPYGELMTEETVESITRDDCKKYYEKYFSPSISYLVVVGDINEETAKTMAKKYFGDWKKKEVNKKEFPQPEGPDATKVAFVDKPGAVQSVINVTYPVDLKPGSEDAIAAQVMNNILGSRGFSGRLMSNLREDKAYTYGAYSSLSSDRLVGEFRAFASVRNEVTDSAVTEFLYEMERIRTELADQDHLERTKSQMAGAFARSLERPQTIARFALNTERYNLPDDYYSTYLDKLSKVTLEDVQRVAKKYIRPDEAIILVVGNQEDVADKLERFAASGEVEFYDYYGNEAEKLRPVPEGVTAQSVIDDYFEALGGLEKLKGINAMSVTREMEIAGMPMTMNMIMLKEDGKLSIEIQAQGQVFQRQVYDGEKGKMTGMMGDKELEGTELDAMKDQAKIIPDLNYISGDYTLEVLGIQTVNGNDAYKMKITDSDGKSGFHFFDANSGLKVMAITVQGEGEDAQTSTQEIMSYMEVDGVKFPEDISQTMGPRTVKMKTKSIEINKDIPDDKFAL